MVMAAPTSQPIVVTHDHGGRFAAQVRSHLVFVDQPESGGGEDTAPMPLEMLGVSLGTCVALYVQRFLHARKLPYEGMRVEVDQVSAQNPNRIADFQVRVILPAVVPSVYAELLERVARSCPAHNTLVHSSDVRVSVEAPARAVPA
jgi:uncharacterized OsmC-like protein